MSYAQRKEIGGNRTLAAFFTVVVVGALLYGIVTGLAFNVIKKSIENLKVIDVEEQPPPPEKPPPPPKDMPKLPPPPMTPPPLVQTLAPPPQIQTVTTPYIPPLAPSPPAPPPPPRLAQAASPAKGDVRSSFSDDDYPESAIAAGAEGTAQALLSIGTDGRVTGCSLIQSTGNGALDSTTCNILKRRVKFIPARDSNGNAIATSYKTPQIRWVLPPQ